MYLDLMFYEQIYKLLCCLNFVHYGHFRVFFLAIADTEMTKWEKAGCLDWNTNDISCYDSWLQIFLDISGHGNHQPQPPLSMQLASYSVIPVLGRLQTDLSDLIWGKQLTVNHSCSRTSPSHPSTRGSWLYLILW